MLNTGFEHEPVDSIAMIVTPWLANQSDRSSRSRVMAAKVSLVRETLPAGSTLWTVARVLASRPHSSPEGLFREAGFGRARPPGEPVVPGGGPAGASLSRSRNRL
jgi:hypothetical protein